MAEQSLLVTTPTLSIDIPAQENLLQKHKERVEKLPQEEFTGRIIFNKKDQVEAAYDLSGTHT